MSLGWLLTVLAGVASAGLVSACWLSWRTVVDELRDAELGEGD